MRKIALISIIILGSVLRLVNLGNSPSGLNADEAALGYNAYSLIETGRDEHGNIWPVNLESFGDFKPAAYTYILIPFIKVLGLNEWAVRLPSAIFGITTIFLIYKLAEKTTGSALISSLVLAISPWHIHFSRGAWEVNLSTMCIVLAVVSFLNWVSSKKIKYGLISSLSFIFAMYSYQSARILAPLIGVALVFLYWNNIKSQFKSCLVILCVSVLTLMPLFISVQKTDASSRLAGVGIFADMGPINRLNQLRGQHYETSSLQARLLHNKIISYGVLFVNNYLDHYNGDFLFVNGDKIERNKIPETGLLYLIDIIFLVLGIILIIRLRSKNKKIIPLLLLISPVAAALTFQTPHALRAHLMVIPLSVIVAVGIKSIISNYKFIAIVICCAYFWLIMRYYHEYHVHYPQTYPSAWEFGFKQVAEYIAKNEGKYQQIIVTNKYDQPYILFLFYLKYSPEKFQNNHVLTFRDKFNFSTVNEFDKYIFKKISNDDLMQVKKSLIIASPEEIPNYSNSLKSIYFPNGDIAFKIIESN